jgi:hypothetical protein
MSRTQTDILSDTLKQFRVPNQEELLRGDPEAIAILWEDRRLLLRLASMELECEDEIHRPELESLLADIKRTCLECTPCLRKLLVSAGTESRTRESLDCASRAYASMKAFLEEACEYLAPDMLSYYQVKFG